jgi:hypothetical protein
VHVLEVSFQEMIGRAPRLLLSEHLLRASESVEVPKNRQLLVESVTKLQLPVHRQKSFLVLYFKNGIKKVGG